MTAVNDRNNAQAVDPPPERLRTDDRAARRAAARAFRPRRALPAIVVAAVLAAAAILTVIEVILHLVHRPARLLPVDQLARLGRETYWDDPLVLTIASVAVVVGLLLGVLALWPGRAQAIALASDDTDVVMGMAPGGLRRHVAHAAETVDGIARAKATIRRRRIRVRAASPLRDARGLAEQVRQAVATRVDELAPLHTPRIRVTVRRRKE